MCLILRKAAVCTALMLALVSPAFGATLHLRAVVGEIPLKGITATLSGPGKAITESSPSEEIVFSDISAAPYHVTFEQPWRAEFQLCVPDAGLSATLDIGFPESSCYRIFACAYCDPPDVELHGRVLDETATPVSGSYISLSDGATTRSDVDGNFTLLIKGGYGTPLSVSARGYVGRTSIVPCDTKSWVVTLPRTCDGR